MKNFVHCFMTFPAMYEYVMDVLIPSINDNYKEMDRYNYHCNVLLQGLTPHQVNLLYLHAEFPITYTVTQFEPLHSKERQGTRLATRSRCVPDDYDFYLVADDDFLFKSGSFDTYQRCIDYLESNPDCSHVMCGSYLGGYLHPEPAPYKGLLWINKGLVFKNLSYECHWYDRFYNKSALTWTNTSYVDDNIIALFPLLDGYYPAKMYNCPTIHYDLKVTGNHRIPKRLQKYFEYKLNKPNVFTLEKWKNCDDYRLFDTTTNISKIDQLTESSIGGNLRLKDEFLNGLYKQMAMSRFGRARLLEKGVTG